MSRRAQYVILCEDLQSQVFLRRALLKRGIDTRRVRLLPLPAGRGSGEQYVLQRYAREVEAYRSQSAHLAVALIVHVDADPQNTVADRHTQLGVALQQAGQSPRSANEHISHIVPKRNVETWIHFYLNGPPVDEATEYAKYSGNESACWPAAERFSDEAVQSSPSPGAPASLVQGLQEFVRAL